MGQKHSDVDLPDSSEKVIVSSVALIKMLRHGRAGVPMEVMGLMLGELVDKFTTRCIDVFSMPQSGNSVSVEAVDPAYQAKMLEMLARTGRPESVVGWYHSHPGFGCWFSGTDINTQMSFEQLNSRAVGMVVDPIQSVKGKVVMDCFRLINLQSMMMSDIKEPRQHTSNDGQLEAPPVTALIHGLNRHYYSITIRCEKTPLETSMLLALDKDDWKKNLEISDAKTQSTDMFDFMKDLQSYSASFKENLKEELECEDYDKLRISRVGKIDPHKRLKQLLEEVQQKRVIESLKLSAAQLLY